MNGLNLPSPKNLVGSPARPRHNHQHGVRQPHYLHPNSPFLSPRGSRLSSPKNTGSPDFIPLGISSPVDRVRQSWKNHNYSNNSMSSNSSTPPSSNSSSFNYSPYRRNNYRGNFNRGRKSFNNSVSSSPHISLYVHKDMLEDPWAELEKKLEYKQNYKNHQAIDHNDGSQNSTVKGESDSENSDTNLS